MRRPLSLRSLDGVQRGTKGKPDGDPYGYVVRSKNHRLHPDPAHCLSSAGSSCAIEWNYTHGVKDPNAINPDNWFLQQAPINRPGNKDIMLALLYDYRTNLEQYPKWQAYFRKHQPPLLLVWGRNDVIFPPSGAHAYLKDLPNAELHLLDTGHFALEESSPEIAQHMREFLNRHVCSGR